MPRDERALAEHLNARLPEPAGVDRHDRSDFDRGDPAADSWLRQAAVEVDRAGGGRCGPGRRRSMWTGQAEVVAQRGCRQSGGGLLSVGFVPGAGSTVGDLVKALERGADVGAGGRPGSESISRGGGGLRRVADVAPSMRSIRMALTTPQSSSRLAPGVEPWTFRPAPTCHNRPEKRPPLERSSWCCTSPRRGRARAAHRPESTNPGGAALRP